MFIQRSPSPGLCLMDTFRLPPPPPPEMKLFLASMLLIAKCSYRAAPPVYSLYIVSVSSPGLQQDQLNEPKVV